MGRRGDAADLIADLRVAAITLSVDEYAAIRGLIDAAIKIAGGDPDLLDHLYHLLHNALVDLDAL